jgi:hypothetical protein
MSRLTVENIADCLRQASREHSGTGKSEGVFWNIAAERVLALVLEAYEPDDGLTPELRDLVARDPDAAIAATAPLSPMRARVIDAALNWGRR